MTEIEKGGPAFPLELSPQTGRSTVQYFGMSLRDYFAAKALSGICASENHLDRIGSFDAAAITCYELADAMLKARKG